jgi:flagellar hook-associated protein 2
VGSSAITFSGFNNIDFNSVLNALMTQASQPLFTLQNRQASLQKQVTTFGTLNSRITAVQSAAEALGDVGDLAAVKGTSSDATAVGVSTSSRAAAGRYDVTVTSLAKAQVTASSTEFSDSSTTAVASGGSLTIGGVTVAITGDTTLNQLARSINETDGIGVHASVIRSGPSTYRLALSSTLTGDANAFTVTNALTGGTGVAFADGDADGTSGDSPTDNAVNAANAVLTVNNVAVTSSSNTIEDIVPGVTLNLYKAASVRVDVEPNSGALETKVQSFITAYNDLVTFVGQQRTAANGGDAASIGRDPVLRQLKNSLSTALLGAHGADTFTRLSEVGVEFNSTGKIELNTARFSEVVAENADAVRNLFGASDGVFAAVAGLVNEFSANDGFIANVTDRLNDQITHMDSQIGTMQGRLALQRDAMQKEFIAADQAMSRLKNQSDSLSGLTNVWSK